MRGISEWCLAGIYGEVGSLAQPGLTAIDLTGMRVPAAALAALAAQCPRLERLALPRCSFGGLGEGPAGPALGPEEPWPLDLAAWPALTHLDLRGNATDAALARAPPALRFVKHRNDYTANGKFGVRTAEIRPIEVPELRPSVQEQISDRVQNSSFTCCFLLGTMYCGTIY